jgi:hypothetical protein
VVRLSVYRRTAPGPRGELVAELSEIARELGSIERMSIGGQRSSTALHVGVARVS